MYIEKSNALDRKDDGVEAFRHPEPTLTARDVAAIFVADLPTLTDAQLAELLGEIHLNGMCAVGAILEPLARAEIQRRRAAISA